VISLARSRRIIAAAEWKVKLIRRLLNFVVVNGGGSLVARVSIERRCTCRLIGACIALFIGSALLGQQSPFQGSVPAGVASSTPLALTLRDAIDRGLRANLGLLLSEQTSQIARADRLRSLSALLPQVTGAVSENVEQIDLKTHGSSARSAMPMRALTLPSASLITASAKAIARPKRANAPRSYRPKMLAI